MNMSTETCLYEYVCGNLYMWICLQLLVYIYMLQQLVCLYLSSITCKHSSVCSNLYNYICLQPQEKIHLSPAFCILTYICSNFLYIHLSAATRVHTYIGRNLYNLNEYTYICLQKLKYNWIKMSAEMYADIPFKAVCIKPL